MTNFRDTSHLVLPLCLIQMLMPLYPLSGAFAATGADANARTKAAAPMANASSPNDTAPAQLKAQPALPQSAVAPAPLAGSSVNLGPSPALVPHAVPVSSQESLILGVLQNINPEGWVASPVRVFSKTALPIENLNAEMDPQKVAILNEFGCLSVFDRSFQRGQRKIVARVYSFKTVNGAFGGYELMREGATTVVLRGDASSEDQQSISFWQARNAISIVSNSQDDDEAKAVVTSIADKISASAREHGQSPDILERMPRLERVKGSERIVMGPLSAKRFINIPYLNTINFTRAIAAGVADYQVQSPPDRLKLLCIDFPTPQDASMAYNSFALNFGGRQIEIAAPFGGMCSVYKLNKTFLLFQQKGRQFMIVANAHKRESAEYLSRFMY